LRSRPPSLMSKAGTTQVAVVWPLWNPGLSAGRAGKDLDGSGGLISRNPAVRPEVRQRPGGATTQRGGLLSSYHHSSGKQEFDPCGDRKPQVQEPPKPAVVAIKPPEPSQATCCGSSKTASQPWQWLRPTPRRSQSNLSQSRQSPPHRHQRRRSRWLLPSDNYDRASQADPDCRTLLNPAPGSD
jgi:hypothetical protein